jgi:hypothetical protein
MGKFVSGDMRATMKIPAVTIAIRACASNRDLFPLPLLLVLMDINSAELEQSSL